MYRKDKQNTAVTCCTACNDSLCMEKRGACRRGEEKVSIGELLNLPNQHQPHGKLRNGNSSDSPAPNSIFFSVLTTSLLLPSLTSVV